MTSWTNRITARVSAVVHWWLGVLRAEDGRWRMEAGLPVESEPGPEGTAAVTSCSKPDEPLPLALLIAQRQSETAIHNEASQN